MRWRWTSNLTFIPHGKGGKFKECIQDYKWGFKDLITPCTLSKQIHQLSSSLYMGWFLTHSGFMTLTILLIISIEFDTIRGIWFRFSHPSNLKDDKISNMEIIGIIRGMLSLLLFLLCFSRVVVIIRNLIKSLRCMNAYDYCYVSVAHNCACRCIENPTILAQTRRPIYKKWEFSMFITQNSRKTMNLQVIHSTPINLLLCMLSFKQETEKKHLEIWLRLTIFISDQHLFIHFLHFRLNSICSIIKSKNHN